MTNSATNPTPNVSYDAGELIAVRGTGSVAVIDDRGSTSDASFGLIAAASSGNSAVISAAVDTATGLAGFGIAWQEGDAWHLALSGSVALTVDLPGATTTTQPTPGGTYRTVIASDATRLGLHEAGAAAPPASSTELAGGAVRASAVAVVFGGAAAPAAAPPPVPAAPAPSAPPAESAPVSIAAVLPETPEAAAPVAATPEPAIPEIVIPEVAEPEAPVAAAPVVIPEPVAPAPVVPPAPTGPPSASQPPPPSGPPASSAPAPRPPEPDSPSTARIRLMDLDDAPVEAAPLPIDEPPAAAADDAVQVLGIRCPADHHNHPDALYCSQCGRRMGVNMTAIARPGPRPPLGIFLIDDVATYPIAEDFIIGREPMSHPEVAEGLSALQLDDESLSISRAHAAIRLDGWDVTAIDLGSANGTLVRRAGSESWEPVSADAPTRLGAGDALRIGEREMQLELHHVQT